MSDELGFEARLRLPYDDAMQKAVDALKAEGFGILTEIDVKATLKQKLDLDFRRYTILGACNPPLAHRALSSNVDVGLFLPCNVTVYEDGDDVVVMVANPVTMLNPLKDDQLVCDVAEEARVKLERAIKTLNT